MKGLAVLVAVIVAGCASRPDDIAAAYVSPTLYQNLSCQQLETEAQAVSSRAAAAVGAQKRRAGQDVAAVAVGAVVFWPALFLTQGDGAQAAEIARLKGEMEAVEDAARRKGCNIQFEQPQQ